MKNYYCIDLKFRDEWISEDIFHSHLFVSDKEMYFRIFPKEENSRIDRRFMMTRKSIGLFEEIFEVVETEVSLLFDNSRIYRVHSLENELPDQYFTVYVSNLAITTPNIHKEGINEVHTFLDSNGLKMVNLFYSFFTNIGNKNQFSISRMNDMKDFYRALNFSFRPELDFYANEKRGSTEFTIKKIPKLFGRFENLAFEEVKKRNEAICSFISFCLGIRIKIEKIIFRTEEDIFMYRNTLPDNKINISDFLPVFDLLKENYNMQTILKTKWYRKFQKNERKITKAIDNYLHSREVNLSAAYLLLFNIIEIFNVQLDKEYFKFRDLKEEKFEEAFAIISQALVDEKDLGLLKDKWQGLKSKMLIKPLKSPLEETLRFNNITPADFGYTFSQLKKTRDKLTHGSVNKIKEEALKSQLYCIRRISASLILANLGLKEDLKVPDYL